ncbi:hypothetical protein [Aureibaculum conchae]|uniref:hypothetical protein n=1 Tax=Aureibaculum sp. 2308TA14-22 TaxID=3108392 RepID=UPI0033954E53
MVEATNYVYLAILICLQYLGLQHESYQITIDFSKEKEIEQRVPVLVDFEKLEDKQNRWILITRDKKHEIPVMVVKDSVTVFDNEKANSTKFEEIDFGRLAKQQDTVYNKKNKAVVVVSKSKNSIVFKMLDNTFYERVTMNINQ